jgi:ATP-dependent exoDNAse (exonuclease V) beta subunit
LRSGPSPEAHPYPEETEDREYPGELRGRMFHSVMQRIDILGRDPEALRREVKRNLGTEWTEEEGRVAALVEEVLNDVERVLDSDLWQEAGNGMDARTEYTISCALGEDTLSGTMDRVYLDAAGVWHVLDYKTDRVDAESLPVRADSYWPQLMFYALLVHRFFSAPRVSATLLFTSAVDRPVRRVFDAEELARIEEEIAGVISSIKKGDFTARRPPCPVCPMAPNGCPVASL